MRERSRLGIAMAAMIKMIATTISNSISEKPFCFFLIFSPKKLADSSKSLFVSLAGVRAQYRKGDASFGLLGLLAGHRLIISFIFSELRLAQKAGTPSDILTLRPYV